MRLVLPITIVLGCVAVLRAQHQHGDPFATPAVLIPGGRPIHHPIATSNPEAQKFFDQGLSMVFGFNRLEALRSFRRAAELDPKAAMPHWGLALAQSQHINMDLDMDVDQAQCHKAIVKAQSLAAGGPEHERRYIDALAKRCPADPKTDPNRISRDYIAAVKELAGRYPDDLTAATLYAEALMVPHRWNWWHKDGRPSEFTEEAVRVSESILRRNPRHPGANHFHVHAVEQSATPERALPSARRLASMPPATGHLVHMAGHIYLQTGDFDLAARANEHAVEMDRGYIQLTGVKTGAYVLGYHPHNTHFIVVARMAQGRYEDALKAAKLLTQQASPAIEEMPEMADFFLPNELFVLARFHKWDEILKTPAPHAKLPITKALWRYARTLALLGKGRREGARAERELFFEARKAVPPGAMWIVNPADNLLKIAAAVLDARLAPDAPAAIEHWKRAAAAQDDLNYDEPSPWYYPVRESLGAALLRAGRAAEAEAVFREANLRHPRQGRILFGLRESLQAQGKTVEAGWVQREFEAAWRWATVRLRLDDL